MSKIALANEINKEEIEILLGRVDKNSSIIDEKVSEIVLKYCKPLINLLDRITKDLESNIPMTDQQLDDYSLRLPQVMFFMGEGQEAIGTREDVANSIRQDAFSRTHISTAGTVADKNARAELASQQEMIVNIIFSRAYKEIKRKMEQGSEMLSSIKKVMSRRMVAMELTRMDSSNFHRAPQLRSETSESFSRRVIED